MKVELKEEGKAYDDFFKVIVGRLRFEKFDGAMSKEVRRLSVERGDSVAVVLFNRQNHTLILIQQFRYPVYRALKKKNGWLYELVAGVVEHGETPQAVVRREVMEEAGYKVKNLKLLTCFFPSPGVLSEKIYVFYAEVAGKEDAGGGLVSEQEDIRVIELPVAQVYKMLEQGKIEDAKTMIGLSLAKERVGG